MSDYRIRSILFFHLITSFFGCSDAYFDEHLGSSSIDKLSDVTVNNAKVVWLEPINSIDEFELRSISKENTLKTGTFFSSIHRLQDNLLLVDRYLSRLSILNKEGAVVGEIKPPSPGEDLYTNILGVDVFESDSEIYIHDSRRNRLDVFSFDGLYLRSLQPSRGFIDFHVLGKDSIVFDVSHNSPIELSDGSLKHFRFLFYLNGKEIPVSELEDDFDLNAVPFSTYHRFFRTKQEIFYRNPLDYTTYKISGISSAPYMNTYFKYNNDFADVWTNKSIPIKTSYLEDKGLPYFFQVVPNESENQVSAIYSSSYRKYFSRTEGEKQIVQPAYFYDFNGTILPAPDTYSNGTYFWYIPTTKYEIYQRLFKNGMFTKDNVLSAVRNYNMGSDEGGVTVISIKF